MAYDKAKKAKADAARYQRRRDFLLAQKKARRLVNKRLIREGSPTKEELRRCIEQGYCWWCQRGGWRRLGQHTAMAHQIYANDLRNIAIMLKRKPTCVKEESEVMSDNRRRAMALGHAKAPDWRLAQGIKHEYSEAGMTHQRELARHMRVFITRKVQERCSKATKRALAKPHPCPVCGTIIPHSTPICCSEKCKKQRLAIGLDIGHNLYIESPEHRARMIVILDKAREKPKPHKCPTCGKLIPKSRPKYCSPECASQEFQLSLADIQTRYLNGESSVELAKVYGCCDLTIRRHLRKGGTAIRYGNSKKLWS